MALDGWILDNSAAARVADPQYGAQVEAIRERLYLCPVGELEQLYSTRSGEDYERTRAALRASFEVVSAPPDLLDRALDLQRKLAHHHGMWHRTPIPDILIAEVALHHGLGVVHLDGDFDRIAEVRPLRVRRLDQPRRPGG